MKNRHWPYQSFMDGLNQQHIEVFNFGEGIIRHLDTDQSQGLCKIVHYNEKGNRILARIAFEYLRARELLFPQEAQ